MGCSTAQLQTALSSYFCPFCCFPTPRCIPTHLELLGARSEVAAADVKSSHAVGQVLSVHLLQTERRGVEAELGGATLLKLGGVGAQRILKNL